MHLGSSRPLRLPFFPLAFLLTLAFLRPTQAEKPPASPPSPASQPTSGLPTSAPPSRPVTLRRAEPSAPSAPSSPSSRPSSLSPADALRAEGWKLIQSKGCLACHGIGENKSLGPSLGGLLGKKQSLKRRSDGAKVSIVIDEAYLRRSLLKPGADVVWGYEAIMPSYEGGLREAEIKAVLAAIGGALPRKGGASPPPESPQPPAWIWFWLILGAVGFAGGHFLLSMSALRSRLIAKFTEGGFQLLYSLVAATTLGLLIWAWSKAPVLLVWTPAPWTRWLTFLLMPVALFFFVIGSITPSPTIAGMETKLDQDDAIQGILRITRHPGLSGFALWACAHLPANGSLADIFLFGSILVLAIGGMLHIDLRRRERFGAAWDNFASRTSRVPFAAILAGKQSLRLSEIGFLRLFLLCATYASVLLLHARFIGVSPWPW